MHSVSRIDENYRIVKHVTKISVNRIIQISMIRKQNTHSVVTEKKLLTLSVIILIKDIPTFITPYTFDT